MKITLKCKMCNHTIGEENVKMSVCQDGGELYVVCKWMDPMNVDEYLTADVHDPREQFFVCENCGYIEKIYEAYTVLGMVKGEEVTKQMKNE